ncbi:hypothetical protein ACFVS2_21225 [Brevibacillus sp. NPDC058079]|uniref:hypothetical protein n=1 Tax=Brevibacillus sp. NPDC058079 TaxID=3346330 RepID=UPI0036E072E0
MSLNISEEFLESDELAEKEKEKTLHRKRRESKEREKLKGENQSNKKSRSGGKKSHRWDNENDDDYEE